MDFSLSKNIGNQITEFFYYQCFQENFMDYVVFWLVDTHLRKTNLPKIVTFVMWQSSTIYHQ